MGHFISRKVRPPMPSQVSARERRFMRAANMPRMIFSLLSTRRASSRGKTTRSKLYFSISMPARRHSQLRAAAYFPHVYGLCHALSTRRFYSPYFCIAVIFPFKEHCFCHETFFANTVFDDDFSYGEFFAPTGFCEDFFKRAFSDKVFRFFAAFLSPAFCNKSGRMFFILYLFETMSGFSVIFRHIFESMLFARFLPLDF